MAITYYKRFRMELDLDGPLPPAILPPPFRWVAWDESLIDQHAEVKYLSFRDEIDAHVFPCLGDRQGCQRLMREIRRKPGFLGAATWMIASPEGYCATIQGVIDRGPIGAIQNVGVAPAYRGLGLGKALLRRALEGFQRAGLKRVYLEVTAENCRRRPALPSGRLPPLEDAVQGGRWVKRAWLESTPGLLHRYPETRHRIQKRRLAGHAKRAPDHGPSSTDHCPRGSPVSDQRVSHHVYPNGLVLVAETMPGVQSAAFIVPAAVGGLV